MLPATSDKGAASDPDATNDRNVGAGHDFAATLKVVAPITQLWRSQERAAATAVTLDSEPPSTNNQPSNVLPNGKEPIPAKDNHHDDTVNDDDSAVECGPDADNVSDTCDSEERNELVDTVGDLFTIPGSHVRNTSVSGSAATRRESEDIEWDGTLISPMVPTTPGLPWHTSWVDDGAIGGCSLPLDCMHYRALAAENVSLIVNLTEQPVTPRAIQPLTSATIPASTQAILRNIHPIDSQRQCRNCAFIEEQCPTNVFDLLQPHDNIEVLFLPMADGSVPSFVQLETFIRAARRHINAGGKVMVHCQAGVGRTGTFLAVYLLEKYGCFPDEAIQMLRTVRPQSLRFHKTNWIDEPFFLFPSDEYSRNYLQERFIFRYWQTFFCKSTSELKIAQERFDAVLPPPDDCLIEIHRQLVPDADELSVKESVHSSELKQVVVNIVENELTTKIEMFDQPPLSLTPQEKEENAWLCAACSGVSVIGPSAIVPRKSWPPLNVNIQMHSGNIMHLVEEENANEDVASEHSEESNMLVSPRPDTNKNEPPRKPKANSSTSNLAIDTEDDSVTLKRISESVEDLRSALSSTCSDVFDWESKLPPQSPITPVA